MKPIPDKPELIELARRIMTLARHHFTAADFKEAIERAPPGILDPRSWAYWSLMAGYYPPPPMPRRRFSRD